MNSRGLSTGVSAWAVALLLGAGCTCGVFDANTTRFACQADADCAEGFVCGGPASARECVRAATVDGGGGVTDSGVDAGVDAGIDAGVDADNDGYQPPLDCNDANPAINPGATESCADLVDNDCDQAADCADSTCNGAACGGVGGTCVGGACVAQVETGLCADGLDNDGDSRVDCLDPDCPAGASCSDFNGCTQADQCGGDGGCVGGAQVSCTTPPNAQCYAMVGACVPDAGATCAYTPRTGTCSDGLSCTTGDTCSNGACVGSQVACGLPPTCRGPGTCLEVGGCAFPPLAAGSGVCSDSDSCTLNDSCDGDGGCAGVRVDCSVPPSQCQTFSGLCDATGSCQWSTLNGNPCDAGTGMPATCVNTTCTPQSSALFPFVPSNFTETQLPATGVALTVSGIASLNTDGGVYSGLASPLPHTIITPAGGQPTMLIRLSSLTVMPGAMLIIFGDRPVIFAVVGQANIDGTIRAMSGQALSGCGRGGNGQSRGGGGGGGYGTFGGSGGNGGGASTGGPPGSSNGNTLLVPLRGGCAGGLGGREPTAIPGAGGGAVQLTVSGTLNVTGFIGAPGLPGPTLSLDNGGGHGGGSGGAVLLEADRISTGPTAWLTANGASGGSGSDGGGMNSPGQPGSTTSAMPVQGGPPGTQTGGGGPGGVLNNPGGPGESRPGDGSGGGGGGVGRIRLRANTTCTVSPTTGFSPPRTGNAGDC